MRAARIIFRNVSYPNPILPRNVVSRQLIPTLQIQKFSNNTDVSKTEEALKLMIEYLRKNDFRNYKKMQKVWEDLKKMQVKKDGHNNLDQKIFIKQLTEDMRYDITQQAMNLKIDPSVSNNLGELTKLVKQNLSDTKIDKETLGKYHELYNSILSYQRFKEKQTGYQIIDQILNTFGTALNIGQEQYFKQLVKMYLPNLKEKELQDILDLLNKLTIEEKVSALKSGPQQYLEKLLGEKELNKIEIDMGIAFINLAMLSKEFTHEEIASKMEQNTPNYPEIKQNLEREGLNFLVMGNDGRSLSDIAIEKQDSEILKMMFEILGRANGNIEDMHLIFEKLLKAQNHQDTLLKFITDLHPKVLVEQSENGKSLLTMLSDQENVQALQIMLDEIFHRKKYEEFFEIFLDQIPKSLILELNINPRNIEQQVDDILHILDENLDKDDLSLDDITIINTAITELHRNVAQKSKGFINPIHKEEVVNELLSENLRKLLSDPSYSDIIAICNAEDSINSLREELSVEVEDKSWTDKVGRSTQNSGQEFRK